jgi:hypothetical protein
MAIRMQQRRGTASQWTAANTVLAPGEIGFETDTGKFKIGDGSTTWSNLSYFKDASDLNLGQANGIATLDSSGQIPVSQLGNLIDGAPDTLNTLNEIVTGLNTASDYLDDKIITESNARISADIDVATTAHTELAAHMTATSNVHGISDMSSLATKQYADASSSAAIGTHSADTTNVHGILDTADLVLTSDPRLDNQRITIDGSVGTAKIANYAVTTDKLYDGSVTTAKIADDAVTSDKIATGGVINQSIADGSVTSEKIAGVTILSTNIADGAITSAKVADSAITSAKIADGTIVAGDIADGTITSAKIADATIVSGDIADGAITSAKILDGTIVNADINSAAAIAATKIAGTAITAADTGTVTSTMIANGTIVNADINGSAAIDPTKIAGTAITAADTGTVTATMLASGVLSGAVTTGSITSDKIADLTIVDGDISLTADIAKTKISGTAVTQADTGTVTSTMIADGTIVAGDIADGAITSAKILDGTIVNADISATAAIAATKIAGTAITAADTGTVTSTMIADGTIVNADINASAAIAATKISGTAITAADTGTVTSTMIADGTIVNGDISSTAAIATSKISGLDSALAAKAPLAAPALTGNATAENLTISGNLVVNGTTTTVSSANLELTDSLIYLSSTQYDTDAVDIGIYGAYGDINPGHFHTGLVRDASDSGKWKLISGGVEPTSNVVDFTSVTYDTLKLGGVEFSDGAQTKQGVPSLTTINQQTGAYTTVLTDRDKLVEINSASGVTLTIPLNSSVAYPVGTSFDILQTGAGQVTIAGAAGVTVNATPGLKLRTQWSSATLFKRATDTWVVFGDLTA